jgi:hypothetical protein
MKHRTLVSLSRSLCSLARMPFHRPNNMPTLLYLLAAIAVAPTALATRGEPRQYGVRDFVRMRCSLDPTEDVFMQFEGSVFSDVPQQKQKLLFTTVGMNVARCLPHADGSFTLTTRELLYYLDPGTSEKLLVWENPWTNVSVPVVHVANDPVQNPLSNSPYSFIEDSSTLLMVENIPLFYPNPLAGNSTFAPYAPQTWYQSSEYFHFETPSADFHNSSLKSIPNVHLAWFRSSQYLPWMMMGDAQGTLSFSSYGSKLPFAQLHPLLKQEIRTRVPLFAHAPPCALAGPSVTSWTYFGQHFDAYLNREEFPVPAATEPRPCLPGSPVALNP